MLHLRVSLLHKIRSTEQSPKIIQEGILREIPKNVLIFLPYEARSLGVSGGWEDLAKPQSIKYGGGSLAPHMQGRRVDIKESKGLADTDTCPV